MKKTRSQQNKSNNRLYVLLTVGFLAGVFLFQLGMLYNKGKEYTAREELLKQQLQEQQDKQRELSDYERYTKTEEYTKNMAKSKLGLVSPNEIIFRERP